MATHACKADRYIPEGSLPDFSDYLRINLLALIESDLSRNDQITIMQPIVPANGISHWEPGFYDVLDIPVACPVVRKKCHNSSRSSYQQYLAAFKRFSLFDYYVFIEDDYYVANKNFKSELIDLFKLHRENIPESESLYLCSLAGHQPVTWHARISNGITDRASLLKILNSHYDVERFFSSEEGEVTVPPQILFSTMFDKLRGFNDTYNATYWASMLNKVCLVGGYEADADMFHPVQYLYNSDELWKLE